MRAAIRAIVAALSMVAPAGTAVAASHVVSLPLHGTLSLAGSHVLCGSGRAKGLTYIDCGIGGASGQPKRGGYVALLAANGKVSVIAVSTNKVVFDRVAAPLALRAPSTSVITVHPGDEVRLPGVAAISCKISSLEGATTILCFYVDRQGGVRPRSFSFGMSDRIVTTLGWDASRTARPLHDWIQNG